MYKKYIYKKNSPSFPLPHCEQQINIHPLSTKEGRNYVRCLFTRVFFYCFLSNNNQKLNSNISCGNLLHLITKDIQY